MVPEVGLEPGSIQWDLLKPALYQFLDSSCRPHVLCIQILQPLKFLDPLLQLQR